jgi:hypothetical protein
VFFDGTAFKLIQTDSNLLGTVPFPFQYQKEETFSVSIKNVTEEEEAVTHRESSHITPISLTVPTVVVSSSGLIPKTTSNLNTIQPQQQPQLPQQLNEEVSKLRTAVLLPSDIVTDPHTISTRPDIDRLLQRAKGFSSFSFSLSLSLSLSL